MSTLLDFLAGCREDSCLWQLGREQAINNAFQIQNGNLSLLFVWIRASGHMHAFCHIACTVCCFPHVCFVWQREHERAYVSAYVERPFGWARQQEVRAVHMCLHAQVCVAYVEQAYGSQIVWFVLLRKAAGAYSTASNKRPGHLSFFKFWILVLLLDSDTIITFEIFCESGTTMYYLYIIYLYYLYYKNYY